MKINTIVLAATAFAAMLPGVAQAQDQAAPANSYKVSQSVQYNDLDLTGTPGRVRLDRRLSSAVRTVCGSADTRQLAQMARIRACRRAATADAARGREFAMASSVRRADVAMMTAAPSIGQK